MKKTSLKSFNNLGNIDTFHVLEADIVKMRKIQNQEVQVEFKDPVENDTTTVSTLKRGE